MVQAELLDDVRRLFPTRRAPHSTRIGVEQEHLALDTRTGGVVPIERVRPAVAGLPVAFEPGGQVELNLPPVAASRLATTYAAAAAGLQRACRSVGVRLETTPLDHRDVPLQLRTPRYLAMQAHFDTIGPAGRRMMRRTAGTQVCLDWWPGRAGLEQWRLLLLAGPLLAAALNRSDRLATWLAVDPARTGFDDRLLHGDDPVAAYADLAAGAGRFVDDHLSTLFPPVRPRGRYLEVRFLDALPHDRVAPVALALAGLLYDDDRRRRTLARLQPEAPRLAEHWQAAAFAPHEIAGRAA